jgi:isopentenyl-diphosphate delta-isomerase
MMKRKEKHLEICLKENIQARTMEPGFREIFFIHKSLPELDLHAIDLSTKFLGHNFSAPIIIAGMTGGTTLAKRINAALAEITEKLQIGMGVGSQRIALENPELAHTFRIAREKAPTAFLIANIGGVQLLEENAIELAREAVDMINANALAIHLNPLQEAIQAEGQTNFKGILSRIKELAKELDIPIIAKETGAGFSAEVAKLLENAGVKAVDVGGTGGTSWSAVEYYRAKELGDELRERLGNIFWDWGIPTAISVIEVRNSTSLPIVATGGIRSGIDVAKSISLGADVAGIAHPLLKPALKGPKAVAKELELVIAELRTAMFLIGCESIGKLKEAPVVITGKVADWLKARGYDVSYYAKR